MILIKPVDQNLPHVERYLFQLESTSGIQMGLEIDFNLRKFDIMTNDFNNYYQIYCSNTKTPTPIPPHLILCELDLMKKAIEFATTKLELESNSVTEKKIKELRMQRSRAFIMDDPNFKLP